jgi:hypothetical protein
MWAMTPMLRVVKSALRPVTRFREGWPIPFPTPLRFRFPLSFLAVAVFIFYIFLKA